MTELDRLKEILDERKIKWIWCKSQLDGLVCVFWERPMGTWVYAKEGPDGSLYHNEKKVTAGTVASLVDESGTCRDLSSSSDDCVFACSRCGCVIAFEDYCGKPTMWVDGVDTAPTFCPNCGALIDTEE